MYTQRSDGESYRSEHYQLKLWEINEIIKYMAHGWNYMKKPSSHKTKAQAARYGRLRETGGH